MGQVIHVIFGPESEFFMDVHGAKLADITNIISALSADEKVFLSLTRTRSEKNCVNVINSLGIFFTFSFSDNASSPTIAPSFSSNHLAAIFSNPSAVSSSMDILNKSNNFSDSNTMSDAKVDKCDFCGNTRELLPLSSINVCATCALIDLKRILNERRNNKNNI